MDLEVLIIAQDGFEPIYAKPGDAGCDLRSTQQLMIAAGERMLVPNRSEASNARRLRRARSSSERSCG